MRKTLLCALLAATASLLSAQVLDRPQVKNTVWTGFGKPFDHGIAWYGLTDYFQARFDLGSKFTMEGMLNIGLLADYNNADSKINRYTFGTTNLNPLAINYSTRPGQLPASQNAGGGNNNGNVNRANLLTDALYVNFLYHAGQYFDIAVGTALNWQVGPAPSTGGEVWEPDAHVTQGGFSTAYEGGRAGALALTSDDAKGEYKFKVDEPGSADVVGFVPFANSYAKRAVGARYVNRNLHDMYLELGLALPNAFITNPAINVGASFAPLNWLSISAVFEGINFRSEGTNFYAGVKIGDRSVVIGDLYLALDNLFTGKGNDGAYALGATVTFDIPNTNITMNPELGFNWFENSNYTLAFYFGTGFYWNISGLLDFNAHTSFAWGSKDRTWNQQHGDWFGGFIWSFKPSLKFTVSDVTSFDVYVNCETRTAYNHVTRWGLTAGFFYTQIIR